LGRRLGAAIALALAVPSLALASKPPSHGHKPPAAGNSHDQHGKSAPQVMYVLKGSLSSYTPVGATYGTITITITHTNHQAKTLVNPQSPLSLRIIISWGTKVVTRRNANTIANGDRGVVKIRLPWNTPAVNLTTTLTTLPTVATEVIDQGRAR
jgi:hypothetical protein